MLHEGWRFSSQPKIVMDNPLPLSFPARPATCTQVHILHLLVTFVFELHIQNAIKTHKTNSKSRPDVRLSVHKDCRKKKWYIPHNFCKGQQLFEALDT